MLQENILKEAPRLNKKIVIGYRMLAREFGVVNGVFSDLRCLMNTLHPYLSNTDTFVMSTLGSVPLMSTVLKGYDCTRES